MKGDSVIVVFPVWSFCAAPCDLSIAGFLAMPSKSSQTRNQRQIVAVNGDAMFVFLMTHCTLSLSTPRFLPNSKHGRPPPSGEEAFIFRTLAMQSLFHERPTPIDFADEAVPFSPCEPVSCRTWDNYQECSGPLRDACCRCRCERDHCRVRLNPYVCSP